MIDPSLALQAAIRQRLATTSAVTALVPADAIFDRHGRPERFPCVLLGEGQTLYSHLWDTYADTVFADLHIWAEEPGLSGAKAIAGAIREALLDGALTVADHRVSDLAVASARFLRDPGGLHSHGILTVEALMQRAAA
ncbi:MAG: DUF3168 domain-containing protein [Bauldia sp.]|nr:DUF3168 domain-containing protein [Bauldia sp.]